MPRQESDLFVRPLFYEALSGIFLPPDDRLHQSQTMGRLAYAAFSEGERSLNHALSPPYPEFTYLPDWASGVTVKIDCEMVRRSARTLILQGIHLSELSSDRRVYINDTSGPGEPSMHIGTRANDLHLSLSGNRLYGAKETVARLVQSFFNGGPI